jgi:hypothetical protein
MFGAHRHHRKTLDEGRPVRVVRHSGIGVDVGDRVGVLHHPTGNTRLEREPPALPEGRDGVLVGVMALVAIFEHERHAVGADEATRGRAHDGRDGGELAGEREVADGRQQIPGKLRRLVRIRQHFETDFSR